MKTFYIVYEDADSTDQHAVFISAPSEILALKSLPDHIEVVEVLVFEEDEVLEFGLETGGEYADDGFDGDWDGEADFTGFGEY